MFCEGAELHPANPVSETAEPPSTRSKSRRRLLIVVPDNAIPPSTSKCLGSVDIYRNHTSAATKHRKPMQWRAVFSKREMIRR